MYLVYGVRVVGIWGLEEVGKVDWFAARIDQTSTVHDESDDLHSTQHVVGANRVFSQKTHSQAHSSEALRGFQPMHVLWNSACCVYKGVCVGWVGLRVRGGVVGGRFRRKRILKRFHLYILPKVTMLALSISHTRASTRVLGARGVLPSRSQQHSAPTPLLKVTAGVTCFCN